MPGDDERIRSTIEPLDISELPETLREGVSAFRMFARENWEEAAGILTDEQKATFQSAKDAGQAKRNRIARTLLQEWDQHLSDEADPEHERTRMTLVPFLLSDEQLDLALAVFRKRSLH